MDYLKTDINGGMPFDLDDLRWEADAIRNVFNYLGEALRDDFAAVILFGCEITNTQPTFTCSAGAIYIDGEVFRVPQHSVIVPASGDNYWRIFEEADNSGEEVFEDTTTHDTYIKRFAKLENPDSVAKSGSEPDFVATPRFDDVWTTRAKAASDIAQLVSQLNQGDSTVQNNLDTMNAALTARLDKHKERLSEIGLANADMRSQSPALSTFVDINTTSAGSNLVKVGATNHIDSNSKIKIPPRTYMRVKFFSQLRPSTNDWVRIGGTAGAFNYSGDFEESGSFYESTHSRTVEMIIYNSSVDNMVFGTIEVKENLNLLIETEIVGFPNKTYSDIFTNGN